MATPVTISIGNTGAPDYRDYADPHTLDLDIGTGLSNDLVTDDEVWTIEVYEDTGSSISYSTAANISPTTDGTRNITFKAASGHAFYDNITASDALIDDVANGAHFTFTATYTSNGLYFGSDYTVIDGIQYLCSNNRSGGVSVNGVNSTIQNCILRCSHATLPNYVLYMTDSSNSTYAKNVLVIQEGDDRACAQVGLNTKYLEHCTFINTKNNNNQPVIDNTGGTVVATNVVAFTAGGGNCFDTGGTWTGSSYNASTDTTAGTIGSNDQSSLTMTDELENPVAGSSGDYRAKSTAAIVGAGSDPGPSTDIIGQTRGTTNTMGCWEYLSGGGTPVSSALLASMETLSGVSGAQACIVEGLAGVMSPRAGIIENLVVQQSTVLSSLEALAGTAKAAVCALEGLQGVQAPGAAGLESLTPGSAARGSALENLAALSQSRLTPSESLTQLSNTRLALIECLAGVSVPLAVQYETRQGLTQVSNARAAMLETLEGITIAQAAQYETRLGLTAVANALGAGLENLQGVSATQAAPFAVLAGLARNSAGALETIAQLIVSGPAALETLVRTSQGLTVSMETLQTIQAAAVVPLEALGAGIALTYEDLEMVLSGEIALEMVLTEYMDVD